MAHPDNPEAVRSMRIAKYMYRLNGLSVQAHVDNAIATGVEVGYWYFHGLLEASSKDYDVGKVMENFPEFLLLIDIKRALKSHAVTLHHRVVNGPLSKSKNIR